MTRTRHRVWKYGDNVNTDVIFPGKYTYTIENDKAQLARHALEDLDPSFASAAQSLAMSSSPGATGATAAAASKRSSA